MSVLDNFHVVHLSQFLNMTTSVSARDATAGVEYALQWRFRGCTR